MIIAYSIHFWLYLVPIIPSVLVTIFNLYHLLSSRALHTAPNNHVIILLLSCGLIQTLTSIVWYIHYYRTGTVLSSTPTFCGTWVFIDSSMERHILVFYPNWFATKSKRFLFHYLPLAICILWPCNVLFPHVLHCTM
jgi:hypothetical protein